MTAVRVHSGARQRIAAPARKSASDWCRGSSVVMPTARAPPWASVSSAEKLTCSAPDDERPLADPPPVQVDELLERSGGHDALGPGARHEPRGARPLAAAGGEDRRVGSQRLPSPRPG